MEQTFLSWNFTNWVTVVIMAALGFLLLAVIAQVFHSFRGTTAAPSAYSPAASDVANPE